MLRNILILAVIFIAPLFAQHDFQVELYDKLHDSPTQQKFDKIAPWPVGCVYIQHPGEGEAEMREHFRLMKKLGFTALKQVMNCPGTTRNEIKMIALEEGIIPWWYGQGGWEAVTPELLQKLGIPEDTPMTELRQNEKFLDYQHNVLKQRLLKDIEWEKQGKSVKNFGAVPHVGGVGPGLSDEGLPLFEEWVKEKYQTIDKLNFAWNQQHFGLTPREGDAFTSWEDFDERWQRINNKEYRHLRDIFRFKADNRLNLYRAMLKKHMEFDPEQPFRAGGEMGMFLPFSYRGVDMEGIAELMTDYGSFYPSIHLAWHFDEVDHEIPRPHYMQAALTSDYFKSGWAASWESTGGPQQFSGGKGGNDFTVDAGVMTQLMLNYIAAGYKGFGFWSWSIRTAGWEGGEFALLDRHNNVTDRAVRVGKIGQTCRQYRDELWRAHKEPLVGVYCDWDNEAYWAAMSVQGRDHFRQDPIDARVGVSRALINANVPYEYVSDNDLRKGLTTRYRVIYMPFVISLPRDVQEILLEYVKNGGRLVMDMPSAYYDEYGAILSTDAGTLFEQTFGAIINDYQGAGVNKPYRIGDLDLQGFVINMTPTTANVLAAYDHGTPAITENKFDRGSAVILGYEASKHCFKPGNDLAEQMLIQYTLGDYTSPYACDDAIVYRLAAEDADHYFLVNDGPAKTVNLDVKDFDYENIYDAVFENPVNLREIELEPYSGRWLRCEK